MWRFFRSYCQPFKSHRESACCICMSSKYLCYCWWFLISNEIFLKCINKIRAISMQIAIFPCSFYVSGLKKLLQMNYVYSISCEWIALAGLFWIRTLCVSKMVSSKFCIEISFLCSICVNCQTLLWIVQNREFVIKTTGGKLLFSLADHSHLWYLG